MIENLLALVTLTLMEIVLGIDNIIFIAIEVARLPKEMQNKARTLGLMIALGFRIILLSSLTWLMTLTEPFITLLNHAFSGRDLILLGGGLFLVAKSTLEIHHQIEENENSSQTSTIKPALQTLSRAIVQITAIDLIFSLDSVITAVGMVQNLTIMITAVIISMLIMISVSAKISAFIEKHPTVKMLALAFLIMIGVMLLVEGMGSHVDKGYLYFAMAFSLGVEFLNLKKRKSKS